MAYEEGWDGWPIPFLAAFSSPENSYNLSSAHFYKTAPWSSSKHACLDYPSASALAPTQERQTTTMDTKTNTTMDITNDITMATTNTTMDTAMDTTNTTMDITMDTAMDTNTAMEIQP